MMTTPADNLVECATLSYEFSPTAYHRERAQRFMREHPHVYDAFYRFCVEAKVAGVEKLGAKLVWERLRWELKVVGRAANQEYSLNNNYVKTFAARVVEENPSDFDGFFEFRERKGDRED